MRAVQAQIAMTAWNAPLPPPEMLIRYNDAFPGCAERIVNNAERQSEHRQILEKDTITGNLQREKTGQWMAFVLSLVILIGGFVLIYMNKSVLGTIFIGSRYCSISWNFFIRKA